MAEIGFGRRRGLWTARPGALSVPASAVPPALALGHCLFWLARAAALRLPPISHLAPMAPCHFHWLPSLCRFRPPRGVPPRPWRPVCALQLAYGHRPKQMVLAVFVVAIWPSPETDGVSLSEVLDAYGGGCWRWRGFYFEGTGLFFIVAKFVACC